MIVVGLDTASNRWHAVTDDGEVGFCPELKGKAWDCAVKKPKKPGTGKNMAGATREEKEAHRVAVDEYQLAMRDALDAKRLELARTFADWLTGLLATDDVTVFCEEPLALQTNPATTRILGLAAGALFDRAFSTADYGQMSGVGGNLTWVWIDVAHWKRVVVGNGNADKDRIRECVLVARELDPDTLHGWDDQEDLFDAWCLCEYGVRALNEGMRPATVS